MRAEGDLWQKKGIHVQFNHHREPRPAVIRGKHLREANSVRTKLNVTLPVRIDG